MILSGTQSNLFLNAIKSGTQSYHDGQSIPLLASQFTPQPEIAIASNQLGHLESSANNTVAVQHQPAPGDLSPTLSSNIAILQNTSVVEEVRQRSLSGVQLSANSTIHTSKSW